MSQKISSAALLALLCWSCSPVSPTAPCIVSTDCAGTQVCTNGSCVDPAPLSECTAGQTRPCGPAAVGACRQGNQACVGGKFETTCTGEVKPVAETCNGVDDDCDGQVDEDVGETWYLDGDGDGFGTSGSSKVACARPAGYAATGTDCNDAAPSVFPGASEVCDAANVDENCNGTANEGCGCGAGATVPCCSGRGTQTCQAGALGMCSVSPVTETCNGIDDDCDGQVDEAGAGLCPMAGQVCANQSCACPAGQTQCGVSCQVLGGACSVGTGVCARSGVITCASGAAACSAVAGAPGGETCNGVDDNCNGQVDEAGAGLCPATGQLCTAGACACPTGQQVCGSVCRTLAVEVCDGVDNNCDGRIDEGLTIACLTDVDNDGYAAGATSSQQCPSAARPQAGTCPSGFVAPAYSTGVDCNDASAGVYRLVPSRADADGDTWCVGRAANDCVGAAALAGRRFSISCTMHDDCDDTNANLVVLAAVRADADGDFYCAGAIQTRCMGSNPLPGLRIVAECRGTDDCNDANAGQYQQAQVRADGDGDQYCSGIAMTACIGASPAAGSRLASACLGDDCREGNALATTTCTLVSAYTTGSASKACVFVPPTETFTVSSTAICPLGFTLNTATVHAVRTSGTGTCLAVSQTSVQMSCNGLDGATCHLEGDCIAL